MMVACSAAMSDLALSLRRDRFWSGLASRRDPRKPLLAILCALSLAAVVFVTRFALTAYDIAGGGIDLETNPRPVVLSVGARSISVPRNMIRNYPFARGSVPELELRMHWPTMEGYSELRAGAFRENDDRSPIIYLTLRSNGGALAPEDRARLVYARLLAGESIEGPAGLVATTFAAGHGYDGEVLYTTPGVTKPFVARCAEGGGVPSTCIVEFRAEDGIDVTYRFRRHLLSRWQTVDGAVRAIVASFMLD